MSNVQQAAAKSEGAEKSAEAGNRKPNVQSEYLQTLTREHQQVSIYLMSGIKLSGVIGSYDQYCLVLRGEVDQLVYKHAIATIVPGSGSARRDQRPPRRDRP